METKLTEKQIAHIDVALKDIGVAYRDIRREMTDHVATAVEEMEGDNFYANFRQYMQLHKKELKANYYRFVRRSKVDALKLLLRKMLTLQTALIIAFAFTAIRLLENHYDINKSAFIIKGINAAILAVPMLYYFLTSSLFRSKRFSGLDKLLSALSGLTFLFILPLRNEGIWSNQLIFELYNAIGSGFAVAFLASFFEINKKYKLQYHG